MNSGIYVCLGARSDAGRVRMHNEDRFVVGVDVAANRWDEIPATPFPLGTMGTVLMVADGMGGALAGDRAATLATRAVRRFFASLAEPPGSEAAALSAVQEALLAAHRAILADVRRNPRRAGMGTTGMLAWVLGTKAFIAWSGDSRCYLRGPGGRVQLLSADHSVVWEMVQRGQLTPEEARVHPRSNLITQSLGDPMFAPAPEGRSVALPVGGRLLLCSDGLNGMLPEARLALLLGADLPPDRVCETLITAANRAGGKDNITAIVLDVLGVNGKAPVAQGEG